MKLLKTLLWITVAMIALPIALTLSPLAIFIGACWLAIHYAIEFYQQWMQLTTHDRWVFLGVLLLAVFMTVALPGAGLIGGIVLLAACVCMIIAGNNQDTVE